MTSLYLFMQLTWGFLQSLLGGILFLLHAKEEHFMYHGAVVTLWKSKSSLSLGLFIFMTEEPYFLDKLKDSFSEEELSQRLLVHEYGHTIQSLILVPFYLPVMGIPSTLWGFLPNLHTKRRRQNISYFSFFTEKWANHLGEKVTGHKSMEQLLID